MAGVAIPATIVGVPIWIGRQIRSKLKKNHNLTKKKRRALVGLGSTVALLLSPLVAGITGSYRLLYTLCLYYSLVGVGVPVVLLYVYGVIPITLCRTGTYFFSFFALILTLPYLRRMWSYNAYSHCTSIQPSYEQFTNSKYRWRQKYAIKSANCSQFQSFIGHSMGRRLFSKSIRRLFCPICQRPRYVTCP